MTLDQFIKRMHPTSKIQDGDCPYIKWMLEDHRCSGIGEYKCLISTYVYGEYDQNIDYNECNSKNYKKCDRYKSKK